MAYRSVFRLRKKNYNPGGIGAFAADKGGNEEPPGSDEEKLFRPLETISEIPEWRRAALEPPRRYW